MNAERNGGPKEAEMEQGFAEEQLGDFAAEIALDVEKIAKTIEARIG